MRILSFIPNKAIHEFKLLLSFFCFEREKRGANIQTQTKIEKKNLSPDEFNQNQQPLGNI